MAWHYRLKCIGCGAEFPPNTIIYKCSSCGELLSVEYNNDLMSPEISLRWASRPLTVWRYIELLPISDSSKMVSLGEGGTSLNRCVRLGCELNLKNLYVKNEGENPTGSFKDRGMTVGVTKALELDMKRVACASTGNTSASLAAYAAKAGLECIVLIPSGKVAFGKLVQAIIHGARVIQVKGNFDEALRIVEELCLTQPIYLLNSINPYRLEGQKTIAFEIWDQMGHKVPDKVIVPVGNAGNISAIWKGFKELYMAGLIEKLPEMIGIQSEGAAPIANFIKGGLKEMRFVERPETIATAIRIGSPVNWKKAVKAIKESGGLAETVSDEEILSAQALLARREGIFVEPASAAAIAGLIKLADMKLIDRDETVVCILTGHGLKDPDIVLRQFPKPVEIEADLEALIKIFAS
ncbi:threonine synthase [Candidatus Bathyarchaeota archaeon]|nr:threonine synthase [Candidatus Bathyarchaeota archaeon]